MKKIVYMVFTGAAILSITILFSCALQPQLTMPAIEDAVPVSDLTCYGCHEAMKESFQKNVHGRIASFETVGVEKGCESCHGPGSRHSETGDPALIFSYGERGLSPGQQSALCLQCHTQMNWQYSEHFFSDISCTHCHSIHVQKTKKLLGKSEPSLCFDCHQDIRAKTLLPNHHPVWEGQKTGRMRMVCSDCHEPHGSAVNGLKTDERLNDLCLTCHARYQGPFVFEHEPVVEDCCICHDPHGSVADNLLKQNEPYICLQCHQFHFHEGKIGYEGNVPASPPRNYTDVDSHSNSWRMAWATKCTQCHSQIHGSDLPSQSVPGSGGALTR